MFAIILTLYPGSWDVWMLWIRCVNEEFENGRKNADIHNKLVGREGWLMRLIHFCCFNVGANYLDAGWCASLYIFFPGGGNCQNKLALPIYVLSSFLQDLRKVLRCSVDGSHLFLRPSHIWTYTASPEPCGQLHFSFSGQKHFLN